MENLIRIENEIAEKEFFQKILDEDKETIWSFFDLKTKDQRNKFKAPTIDKIRQALSNKLAAFTHSNRLIDPRISSSVSCDYSKNGDVNAHTEGLDDLFDLFGSSAYAPIHHLIMIPYLLNGEKTNLFYAIKNNRLVANLFNLELKLSGHHFDSLDKRVFIPSGDSYVVGLPSTPAWRTYGIIKAHKELYEQEFLAAKPDLKEKLFVLSSKLRVGNILQGQNASYLTGKKTNSKIIHSVFLPPNKNKSVLKRVINSVKKNGLSEGVLLLLLKDIVADSGVVYAIAKEIHKANATDDILSLPAPNNAATRQAYEKLGGMSYQYISTISEFNSETTDYTAFIESNLESIAGLAWNRIYYKLPKHYVFSGAKELFINSFSDSVHEYLAVDTRANFYMPSVTSPTPKKYEGSFLRIIMSVDGYDAGTSSYSLGPVQPVTIYGWLHNLLERNVGVSFKKFTPIYSSILLHDQACTKAYEKVFITRETFADHKESITNALESGVGFDDSWISFFEKGRSMSTVAGLGDRILYTKETKSDKASSATVRTDVQASAEMSVLVELNHALSASEAEEIIKKIKSKIVKTRLGGGLIKVNHVGIYAKEPSTKGFALKRREVDGLKNWIQQLSFVKSEYIGEIPTGLLAIGYDSVKNVPDFIHDNQAFSTSVVETVYKGFSFAQASNKGKAWFYPSLENKDNNGFYFSLI
jgi:hypothetical protein